MVIKLGFVSFFADISSEMLYPITPIFLTSVLGASMVSVGFIEGVAESIASFLKVFSGQWSDRILRRKPFVFVGYLFSTLAKPLTGMASSWAHVLVARGLDRVGKGLRSAPRDALLAESVSIERRGEVFGWHRAMDTMGAAIGPLLAVIYLSYFSQDLRAIYYLALIPGLLAVVLVFSIKEKVHSPVVKSDTHLLAVKFKWSEASGNFKTYLVSWALFSLTNSSDIFLLLKAKEQGLSLNTVIFMYCFYNLTYSLVSPYFGKLSDRIARKKIMILGLLIFSFVYFGFSLATVTWHFWVLFGIYGLYMAATDGVGKALVVDLADPRLKASSLGVLGAVTGVCTLFASTVAGGIWDHFGSSWTFIYGVAGALCSIIFLIKIQTIQGSGAVKS